MKCDKFMEHLDDFLDISLNDLEMEAMQAHLNECPKCAAEMEKQRALLEELSHLDDEVKAPEGLLSSTMERIHKERNPRKRLGWWIGGGIAAALCVTVAGASMLMGGGRYYNSKSAAFDAAAAQTAPSYNYSSTADMKAEDGIYYDYAYAADEEAEEVYYDAPAAEAPMEPMMEPMPDTAEYGSALTMTAGGTSKDVGQSVAVKSAEEYGLKIIREAYIELQTENYTEDMEKLKALVAEFGGFITSSTENGSEAFSERYGGATRWSEMTIRVPSEQLDAFIERFDSIGIVTSTNIEETDVTAQYADTDRRLQAYQKQYDRVLEMMDKAETVEDLITIESELSRLEMQIEDAQGTLNYWDSRVNMSSVTLYVTEVRRAVTVTENPSLGERMQAALDDSWYDFVERAKDSLVNVYASIPYIVLWCVILIIAGVVVVIVVKKLRKKRNKSV